MVKVETPAWRSLTPVAMPPNPAPTTTTRGVPAGPNSSSAVGFMRGIPRPVMILTSTSQYTPWTGLEGAMSDIAVEEVNFFKDPSIHTDPYPYFDALREKGPVWQEPYFGVFMVTGYDEALTVYNDATNFSSCNTVAGPFTKFPVPFEGDDVSDIIEQYRDILPFSDQLPAFDPPKHDEHRGLLMR